METMCYKYLVLVYIGFLNLCPMLPPRTKNLCVRSSFFFFCGRCDSKTLFCKGVLGCVRLLPRVLGSFFGHFYYKTGEKTQFSAKRWITEWAVAIYMYGSHLFSHRKFTKNLTGIAEISVFGPNFWAQKFGPKNRLFSESPDQSLILCKVRSARISIP